MDMDITYRTKYKSNSLGGSYGWPGLSPISTLLACKRLLAAGDVIKLTLARVSATSNDLLIADKSYRHGFSIFFFHLAVVE